MTRWAALVALAAAGGLLPLDEAAYPRLLAERKGKVVLVNFWATWCEPCRAEMPALARLEADLRAKGFELVTVSADEPEDEASARQFLEKSGVRMPAHIKRVKNDDRFIGFIDPKWSGALPASFLYDRAGRKVRSFIGETDLKTLEAEIRKLL